MTTITPWPKSMNTSRKVLYFENVDSTYHILSLPPTIGRQRKPVKESLEENEEKERMGLKGVSRGKGKKNEKEMYGKLL